MASFYKCFLVKIHLKSGRFRRFIGRCYVKVYSECLGNLFVYSNKHTLQLKLPWYCFAQSDSKNYIWGVIQFNFPWSLLPKCVYFLVWCQNEQNRSKKLSKSHQKDLIYLPVQVCALCLCTWPPYLKTLFAHAVCAVGHTLFFLSIRPMAAKRESTQHTWEQ